MLLCDPGFAVSPAQPQIGLLAQGSCHLSDVAGTHSSIDDPEDQVEGRRVLLWTGISLACVVHRWSPLPYPAHQPTISLMVTIWQQGPFPPGLVADTALTALLCTVGFIEP